MPRAPGHLDLGCPRLLSAHSWPRAGHICSRLGASELGQRKPTPLLSATHTEADCRPLGATPRGLRSGRRMISAARGGAGTTASRLDRPGRWPLLHGPLTSAPSEGPVLAVGPAWGCWRRLTWGSHSGVWRGLGSARDGSFPVRGETPGSLSHTPGQRRAASEAVSGSSAAPACGWVRAGLQVTRALLVDSGNWPVAPRSLGLTSSRTIVTPSCLLAVAQRVPDFTVSKRYRPGGGAWGPRQGCGWPASVAPCAHCGLGPEGLFLRGGWHREPVYSVSLVVWDCGPQTPPVCGCGACVGPGARGLDRSALQS